MNNSELENNNGNHFSASLRIKNCPELHDELSKLIKPTHCHKKGDIRIGQNKWDNDIWIFGSQLEKHLPHTEHIKWIWEQIKPHKEYIKGLLGNNIEIDLFCSFTSEYDHSSIYLEIEIYEMLCELKIPIEFSVVII